MNNPTHDPLEQLFRLQSLLRHRHMLDHRDRGPLGAPHHGQGRILALLKLKPEMSQKELSAILDIRSQSLGELLGKLESQGYLTRTPSESDRRSLDIRLTDLGRQASEQLEPTPDSESFFGCLTPEELQTFSGFLDRLIQKLEEEVGTDLRNPDCPGGRGRGGHGRPFHDHERGPGRDVWEDRRFHHGPHSGRGY